MYYDDFSDIDQKAYISAQPTLVSRIIYSSIQLFILKRQRVPSGQDLKNDHILQKLGISEMVLNHYCDRYSYIYSMN